MDSFALRQEQSELLKSVSELKHKIEIGETRIKELHDEEMRYLKEIPEYKKQSEDARIKTKEELKKLANASIEFSKVHDQLKDNNITLDKSKCEMQELVINSQIILDQLQKEKEDSRNRSLDVKKREVSIEDREKSCDSREGFHKKVESDLDNRESVLSKRENEIELRNQELNSKLEIYENNLSVHSENVKSLTEKRKYYAEDEQLLKEKLSKADKLVKDQIELKAALLLQAEKLSKEVSITQAKQVSLDKNISDLVNQENSLKIKELKIKKMAHDAGLVKELAELSK